MSAERYGGAFSPGGATNADKQASPAAGNRFRGRKARKVDVRGLLLFVLPTPLLFAGLGNIGAGDVVGAAINLAAYASLILGAWLLREGQRAEAAYDARAVAKPPAFPRKLVAAVLAADGIGLAAYFGWGQDILTAAGFSVLTIASHIAAFGLDPMKPKGIDLDDAEASRVSEALDKAEAKIAEIAELARSTRDREIENRVETMLAAVRDMLRQIEADPRDLTRARRYLSVYLVGAHEATRKYAENHEDLGDSALRDDYLLLIGDLEQSFAEGHDKLLQDDRTDLEIEIEVLRERLGQDRT